MMKYLILVVVIVVLTISNLPNSYSEPQQNASLLAENKIFDILEKEIGLGEKISKDETTLQQTSSDLHTFEISTQNQINNIEENSRNESIATAIASVISVIISGYVGWHIHKRQFNTDLSKKHFEDIKEKIIQPFKEHFLLQIDNWNERGRKIREFTETDIISARSLDLNEILTHKTNPEHLGELDIHLFQDLLHNHYPILRKHLDQIYKTSVKYNYLRDETIELVQSVLKPMIENKYRIVDTEPSSSTAQESPWRGSINLFHFSDILVTNMILNIPRENLRTTRHRDKTIIAIIDQDNQQPRIVFQIQPESDDESIIQECAEKCYSNNVVKSKAVECGRIFTEFKNANDLLRLDLVKISSKVILNTRKRLLTALCPYVREQL